MALGLAGCGQDTSPASPSAGSKSDDGGSASYGSAGSSAADGSAGASSSSGSSSAATGSSAGLDAADLGAQGVLCAGERCDAPMACCEFPGKPATQSCEIDCSGLAGEEQLCTSDADCQQTNTAVCMNGVCSDMGRPILGTDAGLAGASPVRDASATPADDDGGVPAGFPVPTTANRAACVTVSISNTACAGSPPGVCVECLFGGSSYSASDVPPPTAQAAAEAGNYLLTVKLGGAAAGQTTIAAESQRGLLAAVSTRAGETAEYAFDVNVRGMEGQPDHAGAPGGYPGLDLFFWGPTSAPPQVLAVGYALATPATKPIVVYIASDSTACDQTGGAYGGWGQMLPEFFGPPIAIANYANSGASSASFMANSSLWGAITSHWLPGDYVLIQFGHNDKNVSDAVVQANLERYVAQAKAANVTPILISPPARVQFTGGVIGDQSSLHAAAAQAAAAAENVAYIDLTALSTAWYDSLGSEAAAMAYHALGTDATHTNLAGAEMLASLIARNIEEQHIPLAAYLR